MCPLPRIAVRLDVPAGTCMSRSNTELPDYDMACRPPRHGRILPAMTDPVSRLNAALEGRYLLAPTAPLSDVDLGLIL